MVAGFTISQHKTDSGLSISLHPLPLLNMSDYCTRSHYTGQSILTGALLGSQTARNLTVENAWEFKLNLSKEQIERNGGAIIDIDYLESKLDQFKQCFSNQDLIGWFYIRLTKDWTQDSRILSIHRQLSGIKDSLILAIFDPGLGTDSSRSLQQQNQLPVKIFEPTVEKGEIVFLDNPNLRLESGEAERIAIEDATKPSGQSESGEDSLLHLSSQLNAVSMLHDRLQLLLRYVTAVIDQQVPPNRQILLDIKRLLSSLGSAENEDPEWRKQSSALEIDALTSSLLALVTKGTKQGLELSEKKRTLLDEIALEKVAAAAAASSRRSSSLRDPGISSIVAEPGEKQQ